MCRRPNEGVSPEVKRLVAVSRSSLLLDLIFQIIFFEEMNSISITIGTT